MVVQTNAFEKKNKHFLRQIDSTKDHIFLEMCKLQQLSGEDGALARKTLEEEMREEW